MASVAQTAPVSKKMLWAGRIVSALPVLVLLFSGVLKLVKPDDLVKEFDRLGYAESSALGIGILEITCTVIYVMPRTSVLGAILLTGYLGGATATHVRIDDPSFFGPRYFRRAGLVGPLVTRCPDPGAPSSAKLV
jgi:hypothetical protein